MRRLFATLSNLITGDPQPALVPEKAQPEHTRTQYLLDDHDDRTRPSHRINDRTWLKIQKAIDQAG